MPDFPNLTLTPGQPSEEAPAPETSPSPSDALGQAVEQASAAFGQAPAYGQPPAYGQAPVYGQAAAYAQPPAYAQPTAYGQAPAYAQPPAYGQAPAQASPIQLTLDPNASAVQAAPAAPVAPVPTQADVQEEARLTPEELRAVEDFSKKIDIRNANTVLQYGSGAQKSVAEFSETALASVRTKDLGEVGQSLSSLVASLDNINGAEEKKGFFGGFFKRSEDKIQTLKAQYSKVETNVEQISKELQQHQITLLKDAAMLDQLYERNLQYYKELSMYILAGKKRLAEVRATELAALEQQAQRTGSPEDAQRYNDMVQLCERFEKKLHDLELTRTVSLQMGPQIRLIQNNDVLMAEKIQSSLVNTIPLWKSQMVIALGVEHGRQAVAAQNAVTDMTNELLRKNADLLKMGTVETARAAERGVVDIETLQHTNQQLISTIDEVLSIQKEGADKRRAAEAELHRIEGELRQKLMQLHG